MKKPISNVADSVRARLLAIAKKRGDDFHLVLVRYVNERVLHRLAASAQSRRFVLKGASLFSAWTGQPHRATRDLDFLGSFEGSPVAVRRAFVEVLEQAVDDDGVTFEPSSMKVAAIRERQEYGGYRVSAVARVAAAKVPLQIDVGFGDAITPGVEDLSFPTLLDARPLRLRAYPKETMVAEKVNAMVTLGLVNTRMKDFYDVMVVSRLFAFDGDRLVSALKATFRRRKTPFPESTPVALTSAFIDDRARATQWTGFVRKTAAADAGVFAEAVGAVAAFIREPLEVARGSTAWPKRWKAGGPWT